MTDTEQPIPLTSELPPLPDYGRYAEEFTDALLTYRYGAGVSEDQARTLAEGAVRQREMGGL